MICESPCLFNQTCTSHVATKRRYTALQCCPLAKPTREAYEAHRVRIRHLGQHRLNQIISSARNDIADINQMQLPTLTDHRRIDTNEFSIA